MAASCDPHCQTSKKTSAPAKQISINIIEDSFLYGGIYEGGDQRHLWATCVNRARLASNPRVWSLLGFAGICWDWWGFVFINQFIWIDEAGRQRHLCAGKWNGPSRTESKSLSFLGHFWVIFESFLGHFWGIFGSFLRYFWVRLTSGAGSGVAIALSSW